MGSMVIHDSLRILDEDLMTLSEACSCFPIRCSRAAVERWIRKGARGVILETALFCGRRYTSRQAIDRFIRSQLHIEAERPTPKRGMMSQKDIEAKARGYGLPEPIQKPNEN